MTPTLHPAPSLDMDLLCRCADSLRVLAHPHRLKIVEMLLHQEYSVGELAEELNLAPNAVSQHLTNMKAQGILASQREGRSVYYEVIDPNASVLLSCIRQHAIS